jgi:ligand-binding SRPBCC domain-containing protein
VTASDSRTTAGAFTLSRSVWLPAFPEDLFPFFAAAENLNLLTPPWLHFRILTPLPIDMRAGTLITYRLRLRGIPLRWLTQISAWDPPRLFIDRQLKGPYREWVHTHRFTAVDGGTRVEDHVRYRVPGGALVHALVVRPELERIFDFRQRALLAALFTVPGHASATGRSPGERSA